MADIKNEKAPMTPEEFAKMAEGSIKHADAAHQADQAHQPVAPPNANALTKEPTSLQSPKPNFDKASTDSNYTPEEQNSQTTKQPEVYGHKINVNPQVARENLRSQNLTHVERSAPSFEEQAAPPLLPPRPSPKEMKTLLQDPVFQNGVLKGSTLHQAIQQRALDDNIKENLRDEPKLFQQPLHEGELSQLENLMPNLKKREQAQALLNYELAKIKQEKEQRVQALRYQNESSTQKDEDVRTNRSNDRHTDGARDELARKYKNVRAESPFEEALQKFLADGRSIPDLMKGLRSQFPLKSDAEWDAFFKNALNQNSAEIETKKTTADLMQALFRGVFKKGANGDLMMVSDLSFASGDETNLFKFSQIALKDSQLLALLKQLKPGDMLTPDVLKLLGNEIIFLQLAHVIADSNLSAEQQAAILRSYRQQVSSSSQRELENALAGERRKRSRAEEEMAAQQGAQFAGMPHKDIAPRPGTQKLRLYLLYTVIGATAAIILFILLRNAF